MALADPQCLESTLIIRIPVHRPRMQSPLPPCIGLATKSCCLAMFMYCMHVGTGTLLLLVLFFLFSHNTVTAIGNKQVGTQNHYCMSRDPGLGTQLLPDQFLHRNPHTTVEELVSVPHCCWTTFHYGLMHYCVSLASFSDPVQLSMQIWL